MELWNCGIGGVREWEIVELWNCGIAVSDPGVSHVECRMPRVGVSCVACRMPNQEKYEWRDR